jgi:hypothetical protein
MGRRQAINVIQRATPLTSSTLVHKSQSVSAGIVSWVLLSATGRAQAPRLHSCTQLDLQGGLNGRTEGVTAKVSRQQQLPNAQDTQPSQLPGCAPDDRFVPAVWTLFHGTSASVNKICLFLFSPWEPGIQVHQLSIKRANASPSCAGMGGHGYLADIQPGWIPLAGDHPRAIVGNFRWCMGMWLSAACRLDLHGAL